MGIHRTLAKTRLRYVWPTLNSYVINWVKSCEPCSQREIPHTLTETKLVPLPVSTEPFQCVSTDILGPFKPSKATENIYVLVFICYMTKYVELVPLQNIRATTIADALLAKNIDDEANWDSLIRFIQFAHNNRPCLDSTDYTPFFLIHGRHPRSLLNVNIDNFDIPITRR